MNIKNICICGVQVPFTWGGAEILLQSLQRELRHREYQVDIVRLPFQWQSQADLVKSCLAWRMVDLTRSGAEAIDLVIGTKFPSYTVRHPNKVTWLIHQFRQAYDLYGTPHSLYRQEPEDERTRQLIYQIDQNTLSESQRIFTIAQNTTNRLKQFNDLPARTLYPPPQHIGRYRNDGYGDYVLSVGRLEALKRTHLLVEAMQHVRSPVRCLLVGDGVERARLQQQVAELGLQERVEFLGIVDDETLLQLYAKARAVCYIPYDEDYGYVTLEGFFSYKPVITMADAGGPLEFVTHGQNGYVVSEVQELAAAIDELFDDPARCEALGQQGYAKVKHINWDWVIQALLEG